MRVVVKEWLNRGLQANGGDLDWAYQTSALGAYPEAGTPWNDLQKFAQKATMA